MFFFLFQKKYNKICNSASVYTPLSISWKVISWIMKHVCQILFSVVRSASFPIIQKSKAFIIFFDIFFFGCNNEAQKVFRKCSILLSFLYKTPIKTRLIGFQSHTQSFAKLFYVAMKFSLINLTEKKTVVCIQGLTGRFVFVFVTPWILIIFLQIYDNLTSA